MIAGVHRAPAGSENLAARFLTLSTLALLVLLPPETRGESMVACAFLIALAALVTWRPDDSTRTGQILLLFGVGLAVVCGRAAVAPGAAVEPVAVAILAVAAGLVACRAAGVPGLSRLAAISFAWLGAAVSLFAVYQRVWGMESLARTLSSQPVFADRQAVLVRLGQGRSFEPFATPAALGGFFAFCICVTVGLALSVRGRRRGLLVGSAALQVVGIATTASATAAASLMVAVGLGVLLWSRSRRGLLLAVAAAALLVSSVVVLRGGALTDIQGAESPWRLRAGNYRAAYAMAADHPWVGVGPGGFAESYAAYRQPGDNETRHVHNLPLELVAEWGWPVGLSLAALFFYSFLTPVWRRRRSAEPWRRGLALGLAAFAVHNLADFTAFMPSLLWCAAITRGLLAEPTCVEESRPAHHSVPGLVSGASLAAVMLAALLAATGGVAWNYRFAARAAAFAGESDRAVDLSQKALSWAPWDPDAALALSRAMTGPSPDSLDASERLACLVAADRAVRLSPVRPAARYLRAQLRLTDGDAPGAYADMVQAARLYPSNHRFAVERDELERRVLAAYRVEEER